MRDYRIIFGAKYGAGPWDCYFCAEEIHPEATGRVRLEVHHLDHDHYNNVPENLVPTHRHCHARYHSGLRQGTLHPLFGMPRSEETRKKIHTALVGKPLPLETRAKMSAARQGSKNPFFGKTHDNKARKKMREARLGKPRPGTPESWKHSPETREKLSTVQKGVPKPKVSVALKGRKLSPEHRAAISAGMRKAKNG